MHTKASGHESALRTLDPSHAEIRLLEIEPGSAGAPVRCKYHVATLDDLSFPYEALSYAWGDVNAASQQIVYLEGREVDVTQTLADAFERLRLTEEPRYLWIDALCINQADDGEKTQQVSMMHRIYTQCTQCAIWLGSLAERPACFDDDSRRDAAAKALKAFINSTWWGRIWTVQEAILPHDATVYWGPCEIPWKLVQGAANRFFDGRPGPEVPWEFWGNGSIIDLQSAMRGLEITRNESLFDVLWRWRYRRATDPRDKVYGVLGFRSDVSLPTVTACDYGIDVTALYQRVMADLIRISGDLQPLIGRGGEISDIPGLASWAVDWEGVQDGERRSASNFWDHRRVWHDLGYTADRGLYGVGDGLKVEDDRVLCLHGMRVGRVCVVEDRDGASDEGSAGALFRSGGERWGKAITRFQGLYPGQLPENWMSAFLGLVTGKLVPHNPDHGDNLDDWTQQIVRPQVLFITDSGRFGFGPRNVRAGQEVWLLGGSRVPVILNPRAKEEQASRGPDEEFTFAGECFVYGIMTGEAVEEQIDQQREVRLY
ncbi:hypothetical protein FDECE_12333 [Fusarium decemcellulare]|nr:hypothetical protein FDECE_12333 [Fusarium decemcellulare]